MNAQIFALRSQKELASTIESLIRTYVWQGISMERLEISDDYNEHSGQTEHDRCKLFLRLFKASMVRIDDFAVVVADGRGRWYYMGARREKEPYLLELFQSSMSSVFPAVAVMDRMLILPHTIGDAFERSRAFPWFVKPRDLAGAILADFRNSASVEDAVRQAGEQLKTDIAKLCKRHMRIRRIAKPDFSELGTLLGIPTEYLETQRDQIAALTVDLKYEITSGPVKAGNEAQVTLEVRHEGDVDLGSVSVQVNAPYGVMKSPVRATLEFSGKVAARQIQFNVKPKTVPFCPLEVLFTLDESRPVATPFPIPILLDVEA
jgi:hypothetical protein